MTPERQAYSDRFVEILSVVPVFKVELRNGSEGIGHSFMDVCEALKLDPWLVGDVVRDYISEVPVNINGVSTLVPMINHDFVYQLAGSFMTPVTREIQFLWKAAVESEKDGTIAEDDDDALTRNMLGI